MSNENHPQSVEIDLTADDDGKPAAAVADAPQKKNGQQNSPEVIDLCDETLDFQRAVELSLLSAPQPQRKRRRRTHQKPQDQHQQPQQPHTGDVIDMSSAAAVATATAPTTITPEDAYKRALGPIRMEFVDNFHPQHAFIQQKQSSVRQVQHIYQELLEYKLNLPIQPSSSIFVRAMESRLDLLRILITGPEGTPYEHGIFLLDCHLYDYPTRPPNMKFLTTGGGTVRFNPNLYACGKVCLSLLGTWTGPGWVPSQSTLLQVLVSIQGLVLVPDPYFNEPGYNPNQLGMKQQSETYNAQIRQFTLIHAMRDALRAATSPSGLYPEFAQVVQKHFATRVTQVRAQLQQWQTKHTLGGTLQRHNIVALVHEIDELLHLVVTINDRSSSSSLLVETAVEAAQLKPPAAPTTIELLE